MMSHWILMALQFLLTGANADPFKSSFEFPIKDQFDDLPIFYSGDESRFSPEFSVPLPVESRNLPLYTDGQATPPQATVSNLEKNYYSQLQRSARRFQSDSVQVHERRKESEPFKASKPLMQSGFVPIFKDQLQAPRSPSVIKDLEPPILTASSLPSRPIEFKVSASVQSSQKASAQGFITPEENRPRRTGYPRFLDLNNGTQKLPVRSTASESVVSRVIVQNDSSKQQRSLGVSEDQKVAARKVLDINCDGSKDLGWCELGDKYPRKYVNQVTGTCSDVIQRMYVEVPHRFEKLSDASNFKSELNTSVLKEARHRGSHDAWSWASYVSQGALCDAETGFLRPETARDTSGKWNIIIQTDTIKQRVPLQMCRKTNSPCRKMSSCGLKSQCLQKYNYHLLLSVNPAQKHDCPFMKLYRFPSACVCHVE